MKRRTLATLGLGALALGLLFTQTGAIVLRSTTPSTPFAEELHPSPPDYADPLHWSALPQRQDAGDALPTGVAGIDQLQAPVDVFYVHPTTHITATWNAPTDDPTLNETTDRVATGIQATAFNGCCAVYAPRYRQANWTTLIEPSADGDAALDLAFSDVKRAFAAFNTQRGAERPFVLAAHSQGSVMAERLLFEEIVGTPLQAQMVAAYLPGGSITPEDLTARGLRACDSPEATGCVISWNARGPRYKPNQFVLQRPNARPLLCSNPLSWRDDGALASAEQNLGAVFLEAEDRSVRPGFADAQCVNGTLLVRQIGTAPRDLPSRVLDYLTGPENYHPMELQIFFMNLRENVGHRVQAFLSRAP